MYTPKDIVFENIKIDTRRWNPYKGEWGYSTTNTYKVSTTDGLYESFTDSSEFSYWMNGSIRLGSIGYDYFFITCDFPYNEKDQQKALDILNRIIN